MTKQTTGAVRIRDMEWEDFLKLLRSIAPEMGVLARRGDEMAQNVMAIYQYAYEHPTDREANRNVRAAVEDYINRDLRQTEQIELAGRFGHRLPVPEKQTGPRIFVPGVVCGDGKKNPT